MNRRMALLALSACGALVLVACEPEAERGLEDAEAADAPATERPVSTPYETWDANRDRVLQRDEFAQWRTEQGLFADWVGDEGLDREVVNEDIRVALDVDGDGIVNEDEWRTGMTPLLDDAGTWSDWDADGDSELDANEISESLETRGFYDVIDADSDDVIDDEEIGDFFYDVFDLNDNGEIDVTEWDASAEVWISERDPGA